MGGDGIDAGPRHGPRVAVLEGVFIIHVIVPEPAEVGAPENRMLVAEGVTRRGPHPKGGVPVDGQQDAEIGRRFQRGEKPAAGQVAIAHQAHVVSLLHHDGAQRTAGLGKGPIGADGLQGVDAVFHADFLVERKGVHVSVGTHREAPAARIGNDQVVGIIIGDAGHIALSAGAHRTHQVVEIGMVPCGVQLPEVIFPFQVQVEAVLQVVGAPGRYAHVHDQAAQPYGILEGEPIPQHRRHVVPGFPVRKAGHDRVGAGKVHLLEGIIRGDAMVHVAKGDGRNRFFQPAYGFQGLRVAVVGLLAEQLDGIRIGHHLPVQGDRAHAVPLEFQGQQLSGRDFQRGEQANVRVGQQLHLMGGQFYLPEVRYARIIGTADEITVVQRKTELTQVAVFPGNQFLGGELRRRQVPGAEQQQGMLAVFALGGHRQELTVVAYINIEHTLAKGEGIDDFRVFHILIEPDEGLRSAVGEQTVQVVGGIVINDVVDALEVLPFHHFFLFQVIDHQATHLGVVAGENEALAVFVQGHEGRIVELDAVQVGHLPHFLRGQVQFGDMREAPRRVHGRIGLAGSGIVHKG